MATFIYKFCAFENFVLIKTQWKTKCQAKYTIGGADTSSLKKDTNTLRHEKIYFNKGNFVNSNT